MRNRAPVRRGSKTPSPLGSVLKKEQSHLFKYRPIWNSWSKAVGAEVASHAQPDAVQKNGILIVRVDSSGWMQELQFLKGSLISSLNDACGKNIIKDIQFRLGAPLQLDGRPPETRKPAAIPPMCRLDAEGASEIREKARHIQDPELSAVIERIAGKLSSPD